MPKLLYLSLMRLPTEKAHGLQIMQNCEALAEAGCELTLWVARRWNSREMRAIADPFAHYGVAPNFRVRRIPCIDVFPLVPADGMGARLAFYLALLTYSFVAGFLLLFTRADIYYSRDEFLVALLALLKPRARVVYEAHLFAQSGRGAALQRRAASRAGSVIAITPGLRDDLITQRAADPARAIIAHDGVRRARFADPPPQAAARRSLGWPADAFIVGYLGRLQTIGLDKGVGDLIQALAAVDGACLALVGGPADQTAALAVTWEALGLPPQNFIQAGAVPPERVPACISAFDVCAMPFPFQRHFAYHASPMKLFEYMAAGRVIVASDLPAVADVVADGETALLLPPDDKDAWSRAIIRLRDDAELRRRLGERAREEAFAHYTWHARARKILAHIGSA